MPIVQPRSSRQVGHILTGYDATDRALRPIIEGLNDLLRSPFAPGNFEFKTVTLVTGINVIPHGLGRDVEAFWSPRDATGVAIYSRQAENQFPKKTFWLNSSGSSTARVLFLAQTGVN